MQLLNTVSNLLRIGAQWLQQQRHSHCTDQVTVGGVSLLATCPHATNEVEPGGVKLAAQIHKFMFRSSDLTQYDVTIVRGTTIEWDSNTYEVINEGGGVKKDNDPTGFDIIVPTVLR